MSSKVDWPDRLTIQLAGAIIGPVYMAPETCPLLASYLGPLHPQGVQGKEKGGLVQTICACASLVFALCMNRGQ